MREQHGRGCPGRCRGCGHDDPARRRSSSVADLDRARAVPVSAMACSAFIDDVEEDLVQHAADRSAPAAGARDGVRTISMPRSARLTRRMRQHPRDHAASTRQRGAAPVRRDAGEDQQVADDLRGPIRFVSMRRTSRRTGRDGRRSQQQLDVAEHALQRIVDLVGDAGDELTERGQLFGLREPARRSSRSASSSRRSAR